MNLRQHALALMVYMHADVESYHKIGPETSIALFKC